MTARTRLIPGLAMLGLLLMSVAPANGRTWSVEKDGSGDFTVIQDAVDAASSGDVIEIGAGRFDDFQTRPGGTNLYDIHVLIPENMELTFIGSGPDLTIVGPENAESLSNKSEGFWGDSQISLTIRGLSVENCSQFSIGFPSGSLDVADCRFYFGSDYTLDTQAIYGGFTEGARIDNCTFDGFSQGIVTINSPAGVTVSDCQFVDSNTGIYSWTSNSLNVNISDCVFDCTNTGLVYLGGAGGIAERCILNNCLMALEDCGEVEIYDCEVIRNDDWFALELTNNEPVTLVGNVFQSNGPVIKLASYGLGTFRDNHFLRTGDEYWIQTSTHSSFHDHIIDFSGNWWGTNDVEEIAEGIWDCEDFDTAYNCVVFEPIADGPVSVETHSWSSVKSLFR